jgi:hypothetical protein
MKESSMPRIQTDFKDESIRLKMLKIPKINTFLVLKNNSEPHIYG